MRNEKKNDFWVNVGLFSTNVLDHRVEREKDFPAADSKLIQNAWNSMQKIWRDPDIRKILDSKNIRESDTEDKFISPLMDILGFSTLTKIKLQGNKKNQVLFPDYVLFSSKSEAADAINADADHRYRNAIGILEAKYYGRDLASHQYRPQQDDRSAKGFPATQLTDYLRQSEVDWGILTNGMQWQIYYRKGQYPANRYLEFNLADLLSHPEISKEFRLFIYFISPAALIKGTGGCRLDRIYAQSKQYAQDVGPSFFKGCEQSLRKIFGAYQSLEKAERNPQKSETCFQASLILLFRLIAIRYLEDRGVLPTLSAPYRDLSLDQLRLSIETSKKSGRKFADATKIWQRVRTLFKDVNSGKFGIYPGHKGFETELFDLDFEKFFTNHPLADEVMADAIDSICRGGDKEKSQIDFFDLGTEKIGDVYNDLLGLRLVKDESKKISLAASETKKKELGSYFTHPKLSVLMVENVLNYLRETRPDKAQWLKIRCIDNSCGSGHLLRQLVEDISYELFITQAEAENFDVENALDQNDFRRILAQNCIYGIDRDQGAVWLTKLNLWLHTAEAGKPFVFLDHHIAHGDSILSTVEIPKLQDDLRNKLTPLLTSLNDCRSEDKEGVKKTRDTWISIQTLLKPQGARSRETHLADLDELSRSRFFNYARRFPDAFYSSDSPGFTIITGNPPWETVKPKAPDFYKSITGEEKAPARKELDAWLESSKERQEQYEKYREETIAYAAAIRNCGYELQAGEVYTYSYFIERSLQTTQPGGCLAYIVKMGLHGDEKVKGLRNALFKKNMMQRIWLFPSNKIDDEKLFPKIDPNEKFMVFVLRRSVRTNYAFEAKRVTSMATLSSVFEPWQSYQIPDAMDALARVEIFDTPDRKNVSEKVLVSSVSVKQAGIKVDAELHLTNDRSLFSKKDTGIPIITGAEVQPFGIKDAESWCREQSCLTTIKTANVVRVAVNDILPNSRRKLRSALIPPGFLTANSVLVMHGFKENISSDIVMASANAMITEYYLRPKFSNMHLNNFRLYEMPLPLKASSDILIEIERNSKALFKKKTKFSESSDEYKRIEALLAISYGVSDSEIRSYLASFDDTSKEFISDVVDFASVYREKFYLPKEVLSEARRTLAKAEKKVAKRSVKSKK